MPWRPHQYPKEPIPPPFWFCLGEFKPPWLVASRCGSPLAPFLCRENHRVTWAQCPLHPDSLFPAEASLSAQLHRSSDGPPTQRGPGLCAAQLPLSDSACTFSAAVQEKPRLVYVQIIQNPFPQSGNPWHICQLCYSEHLLFVSWLWSSIRQVKIIT
jgi:hypothetical protein